MRNVKKNDTEKKDIEINDNKEEKVEEIKNDNKKTKKRLPSPGKIAVKIIAILIILLMVFAVAGTCIFYVMYYLQ